MSTKFNRPRLPGETPKSIEFSQGKSSKAGETHESIVDKYKKKRQESRLLGLSDATGSMAAVWGSTRNCVVEMITRISEMGAFQLRWAAYRDYCDGARILESSEWQDSAAPLLRFIDSIDCDGGGDAPEAVEHALRFAAQDQIATRVFLIGDAPPHAERDYKAQARALGRMGRPVFSFVVGDYEETQRTFAEISQLSGGVCVKLRSGQDLMDFVVLTAAEDMGGADSVKAYLEKYAPRLSDDASAFAKRLLEGPKS